MYYFLRKWYYFYQLVKEFGSLSDPQEIANTKVVISDLQKKKQVDWLNNDWNFVAITIQLIKLYKD